LAASRERPIVEGMALLLLFPMVVLVGVVAPLLAWLAETYGETAEHTLDLDEVSDLLGRSEETLRRGLQRLHELGRVAYVPPFRGRATEVTAPGLPEDVIAAVDFDELETKRAREEQKLRRMLGYAQAPGCRVRNLLEAFGDADTQPCGRCDACVAAAGRRARGGASAHERAVVLKILAAVGAHDGRFGFGRLADHLGGSRAKSMPARLAHGATYGALAGRKRDAIEALLHDVHARGLLSLSTVRVGDDRTASVVRLSASGRDALEAGEVVES
jgi:hypothetical protein